MPEISDLSSQDEQLESTCILLLQHSKIMNEENTRILTFSHTSGYKTYKPFYFCILTSFALTNAATILIQFEIIDTVFFSQSAVHQNLTGGWTYCDVRWF